MRFFSLAAATTLCLSLAQPAFAAPEQYEFDKAHTQVLFFVNHLGFSNSQGEFLDYDGGFTFDEENPENSSVEVTFNIDGLDMDDEKWDAHLKNPDFFNMEEYPTMTFKSTDVEVTGENTGNITGDLTILGVTKPVVLETVFNKADVHPYSGKHVAGFSANSKINRSDFGMDYGLPGIGDEVIIRIEVEGVRVEPAEETETEE